MWSPAQQSGQEAPIDRMISSSAATQASGVAPGNGFRHDSSGLGSKRQVLSGRLGVRAKRTDELGSGASLVGKDLYAGKGSNHSTCSCVVSTCGKLTPRDTAKRLKSVAQRPITPMIRPISRLGDTCPRLDQPRGVGRANTPLNTLKKLSPLFIAFDSRGRTWRATF